MIDPPGEGISKCFEMLSMGDMAHCAIQLPPVVTLDQ